MVKVRILFATYSLAFQNPGGGERVLDALREGLRGLGHEVEFYTPWKISAAQLSGFEIIHYFSCMETSFWKFVRSAAPQSRLIVTPTFYQPRGLAFRLGVLRRRMIQRFERGEGSLMSLPDHWLPTTESEAEGLKLFWGVDARKISVLPNGVEERFRNATPERFLRTTGISTPFVLHVGRFHPVKNHLSLIQAIGKARMHCVFIGGPDAGQDAYYGQCREAARRTESSDPTGSTRFTFIDRIAHEDPLLASAYAAASAFVLPSRFETFGISALEAASAGCPLILTRNTEAREAFDGIAEFVDPDDPNDISRGILKIAGGKGRSSASDSVLRRFSWNAITEKLVSIYTRAK